MDDDPYAAIGARPIGSSQTSSPQRAPTSREEENFVNLMAKYADMEADRQRLALEKRRLERLEATPIPEGPKNLGQKLREQSVLKSGEALTGAATTARIKLPTVADQAQAAFSAAEELVAHPGFEAAVGAPNPFKGGFGPLGTFPATPARNFISRLDNVTANVFTQAFETLKGAGAITEKEGETATKALANLGTLVSEAQFKRNLQVYLDTIKRGYDRTKQMSNIQPVPYSRDMLLGEKQRRNALRVDVNPVPQSERR